VQHAWARESICGCEKGRNLSIALEPATEAMFCSWRAACRDGSAATSASSLHLLYIIKSEPIATWAVSSLGTRAEPRRVLRCRSLRTKTSSQLLPSLPLATMVKVVKVYECGGTEVGSHPSSAANLIFFRVFLNCAPKSR
jgi:hypothetical protein